MVVSCPIHGEVRYTYTVCDADGSCYPLFSCPKCGVGLRDYEWERVNRAFRELRIRDRFIAVGTPLLLTSDEVVPFDEEYRLLIYSDAFAVLAVNLGRGLYYVLRLINRGSRAEIYPPSL